MLVSSLIHKQYGRLKVIALSHILRRRVFWLCRCVCGTYKAVAGISLKAGDTQSCGCYLAECVAQRSTTHGATCGATHGKRVAPEYKSWVAMKARCLNPRATSYENYGGRGIKICQRWRDSFKKFRADMGKRPSLSHTLDRINNNGHYKPSNCRWATKLQQNRNKR